MKTRTTIMIDAKLLDKAMRKAGVKTKSAAVEAALKAYVDAPGYSTGVGTAVDGSAPNKKTPARSR